jgi:hypothetical protein
MGSPRSNLPNNLSPQARKSNNRIYLDDLVKDRLNISIGSIIYDEKPKRKRNRLVNTTKVSVMSSK